VPRLRAHALLLAVLLGPAACSGPSSCRRTPEVPGTVAYDLAARAVVAELESGWTTARLASAESEVLQERGFRRLSGPGSDEAAAIAPRATFLLPVAEPLVDRRLVLEVQAEEAGQGKDLEIALDGQVLGTTRMDGERRRLAFDVPAAMQRTPRQRLRFLFPEEEKARDNRRAGPAAARVFSVTLGRADDPAMAAIAAQGSPVTARDGIIRQAAPSRLRFALLRPEGAVLSVRPGLEAGAKAGSSVKARVLVVDSRGERELWAREVKAGERPSEVTVPLEGETGDPFELVLAADSPSDPASPYLAWGAPRVLGGALIDPLQHEPTPVPSPSPGDPAVQGVVFVILDAARADRFGAYGYGKPTTPEADRLAAEGIVFERHVTQAVQTSGSMSAVWSSQYPDAGQSEWLHEGMMPRDRLTLAELLSAQGIEAAGFIANPSAGPTVGLDRGFGLFERLYREPWHTGDPPTASIFRKAVPPWLAKPRGKFLLYVHLREPHTPYGPVLEGEDAPLPPEAKWYQWWAPVNSGKQPVGPAEKDHLSRLYDGNLRQGDDELGALRRDLEKAGLWDEVAVIVSGDHGEMLFEHGYYGHNIQVFEEIIRVPMIVRLPPAFGLAGRRVPALTSHLDVAPTVADLLGVAGRGGSDRAFKGRSLLQVARSGQGARGVVSRTIDSRPTYALVTGRYKLLHDLPTGEEQLYDLQNDPRERTDVGPRQPLRRAALRQSLFRWLLDLRATGGGEVEAATPDATDAEVLRALGYVR
jgi:arylsulfatase A-like enzyme